QQIVRGLAASGISILVTDHDVDRVLELADRVYLITEGKVRCHGSPAEIVRNRVAIDEYLGDRYLQRDYNAQPPAATVWRRDEAHPAPEKVLQHVLVQERTHRLIEGLMGDETQFRTSYVELVRQGSDAVPALLEAMERRDMEMRRRAYAVLHRLTN